MSYRKDAAYAATTRFMKVGRRFAVEIGAWGVCGTSPPFVPHGRTSPTNLKGPLARAETRSEMICIEVRARTLVSPASTSTYPSYFDFFVFRLGTFFPCFRASERPIAIACFRLLTAPPLPPRFSAPFLDCASPSRRSSRHLLNTSSPLCCS